MYCVSLLLNRDCNRVHPCRRACWRPEQDVAQLRLFDGGLRVATGTIAERKPEAYRIDTAIASLEARGKLFDAFCSGACVDPKSNARAELSRVKQSAVRSEKGTDARAWSLRVGAGRQHHAEPRRPGCGSAARNALRLAAASGTAIDAGSLLTSGAPVTLNKGESALFTTGGFVVKLATTPHFMAFDLTPTPTRAAVDDSKKPAVLTPTKGSSTGTCGSF